MSSRSALKLEPLSPGGRTEPMSESRNEDYTVVWLGAKFELAGDDEVDQVRANAHPIARRAAQHGLRIFVDSAEPDPEGPPFWLLVGKPLEFLGYKNGVYLFSIDATTLANEGAAIATAFGAAEISQEPSLHVMVHVQA
jgi:hypothetical protein